MKVSLENITPNAELHIVKIARASSTRTDKTENPVPLLEYLIKNKHWSPFQHSYLTFEIVTSKSIAIQYLRHLSFTFQEFSQRYAVVEKIEDIEFRLQADKNRQSSTNVIGKIFQLDNQSAGLFDFNLDEAFIDSDGLYNDWISEVVDYLEKGLALYNRGLKLGVAKETARFILPQAAQTTLYMTGSVRSWIHLLQLRDDPHAQKEAQLIAKAIKVLFCQELPIIAEACGWIDNSPADTITIDNEV